MLEVCFELVGDAFSSKEGHHGLCVLQELAFVPVEGRLGGFAILVSILLNIARFVVVQIFPGCGVEYFGSEGSCVFAEGQSSWGRGRGEVRGTKMRKITLL